MATDLEWEVIARRWDPASRSCILELRDRIEALEAAQNLRQQDEDVERLAVTEVGLRAVYDLGRQHGAAANSKPTPNDRQIRSSADTGLLPMIVSETGSDDEPETERIICSAISGGADYVNGMPRELSLQRIRYGDLHLGSGFFSARYVQAPAELTEPHPAPASGLVEVVCNAIFITEPIEENARAAIRAVAAAARARDLGGQSVIVVTWAGVARWLEEEAGR